MTMRMQIEATDQVAEVNGVRCRIWRGVTESGVECHLFACCIAVANEADHSEFERELESLPTPNIQPFLLPGA